MDHQPPPPSYLKDHLQTGSGWTPKPAEAPTRPPHQLCYYLPINSSNFKPFIHEVVRGRVAYLQMSNTFDLDIRPHWELFDCYAGAALEGLGVSEGCMKFFWRVGRGCGEVVRDVRVWGIGRIGRRRLCDNEVWCQRLWFP